MDKIGKALRKLSSKERNAFTVLLRAIQEGRLELLDVKKLAGHDDIFRVRKGSYRVIFRKTPAGEIFILAFERRSDRTYSQW